MAKFSLDQKIVAAEEYLHGKGSYRSIGKALGTDHKAIQKWVALYKAHGTEGLILRYTNYSAAFKMDVLNYMNETGASVRETAAVYQISAPSTVLQWKRILEEQGIDALHSKKRGRRPSIKKESKKKQPEEGSQEALLAEIERLRMENAYLKKLNVLVQEEKKSQSVKKRR
jgi:transposase